MIVKNHPFGHARPAKTAPGQAGLFMERPEMAAETALPRRLPGDLDALDGFS